MDSKRIEIVKVANRLFSEKGYNNTSVDEIAKESGMAKASFYKQFHSKEELLHESIVLFSQRVEKGIEAMVEQSNLSPKEKLHRCTEIYLECIFDNNIHLLLVSTSDMISFEMDKINEAGLTAEQCFNLCLTECLISIYGEQIEVYVADIAFIAKGVVAEYIRILGPRVSAVSSSNLNTFVVFIENMVDIVVCGILERSSNYTPILHDSNWLRIRGESGPLTKKRKVKKIISDMEKVISSLTIPNAEKTEYYQVMLQLKDEIPGQRSGSGLLKACFMYLEQRPELKESCRELRSLFELDM